MHYTFRMENSSEFLRYLAYRYDHAYDKLRVRRVTVDPDADSIVVEFVLSYEDYDSVTDEDRAKIDAAVKFMFADFASVKTVYRKNLLSKEAVSQLVRRYIGENNRALFAVISDESTEVTASEESGIRIVFDVSESVGKLLASSGFLDGLTAYLRSNYNCDVTVTTNTVDTLVVNERADEEIKAVVVDDHVVAYKLGHRVCGGEIRSAPKYISTFKSPAKYVCMVGEVSGLIRANSKKSGNLYYAFTLGDTTAVINCRYFTRKQHSGPLDVINDGDSLIVSGDIIEDSYSGGITLNVRTVWTCTIDYSSIITKKEGEKKFKPHRELRPEKVELVGQQDLFDTGEVTPMLRGKTFVVFDLETTGLETESCSIIEICGVKVVDGKIVNYISTLVDPATHIPEGASETNHIYDDDVKDAPYIEDVLPQFAAWVGDAALVAHNGFSYDFKVLDRVGASMDIFFGANARYDTIQMAYAWHEKAGIRTKLNLASMCKEFGIELTNAHRAYYDTLATAQLFVKRSEKMDETGVSKARFSR